MTAVDRAFEELGVDLSDRSDEFVAGFLAGAEHAQQERARDPLSRAHLLVLLEGDVEAQRLLVTWPIAFARRRAAGLLVGDRGWPHEWDVEQEMEEPGSGLAQRWEEVSRVDRERVARIGPSLLSAGLVDAAGIVDEVAMAYVQRRMREQVTGQPPKGRRS